MGLPRSVETVARAALPLLLMSGGGAAGFLLATGLPGCTASPCTQSARLSTLNNKPYARPAPAVECPSGTLCYQGSCMPSCSAGTERAEECTVDGDCQDPARSTCVDGFCSACGEGEVCLPELNVCAPISEAVFDGGPAGADGSVPASEPLDGGAIDGSIFTRDTGPIILPPPVPPSHLGDVFIAQVERGTFPNPATTSSIAVSFLNVTGTGYVESATVTPLVRDGLQSCAIWSRPQFPLRAPVSENMGDINIENSTPAGFVSTITAPFKATHTPNGYVVVPRPPSQLLVLSSSIRLTRIRVSGPGRQPVTDGTRWPPGTAPSDCDAATGSPYCLLVPFTFEPTAQTDTLLNTTIRADQPTGQQLVFAWRVILSATPPGVRMVVRVPGVDEDLICTAPEEPGEIRVPVALLQTFAARQPAIRGVPRDLVFEREYSAQLQVTPGPAAERIIFRVRVHYSKVGRIQF
ncbi:MAG: hypothetical protein IT384_07410 [Deltaproteobacteria bacterium]|nr:hypothetical protein [Deltaproteobacteria bacterium]